MRTGAHGRRRSRWKAVQRPASVGPGSSQRAPFRGQQLAHELIAREDAAEPMLTDAKGQRHAAVRQHAQSRLRDVRAVPHVHELGPPRERAPSGGDRAQGRQRRAQRTPGVGCQERQLSSHVGLPSPRRHGPDRSSARACRGARAGARPRPRTRPRSRRRPPVGRAQIQRGFAWASTWPPTHATLELTIRPCAGGLEVGPLTDYGSSNALDRSKRKLKGSDYARSEKS